MTDSDSKWGIFFKSRVTIEFKLISILEGRFVQDDIHFKYLFGRKLQKLITKFHICMQVGCKWCNVGCKLANIAKWTAVNETDLHTSSVGRSTLPLTCV